MVGKRMVMWIGVATLLFAACGPAATPTPTPTTAPRATPRATPTPTATPRPTPTLAPGETPHPTPTPRPTPIPTATTAPVGVKYGGTLKMINDYREPRGWDGWFWKSGARDVRTRHNLNFSQLFDYAVTNPDKPCQLQLQPELAESWNWVKDDLLEIKLRQGVKFHNKPPVNGRELTAEDVSWSLNHFILEDTIRGWEAFAPHVKKIEATGRYTVQIQTDGPFPVLISEGLTSVYGSVILPPEVVDEKGRWEDPKKSYIGTGPFTFKEHVPGVRTTFVRHPNYFKKGLPYLDAVDYMVMPDVSTQVASLRSGAVDLIFVIPTPMALALKGQPSLNFSACPVISSFPGRLYYRTDQPPFDDVRVRRAVQMSIDRQGLLDAVLQGKGVIAPHYPGQVNPYYWTFEELPPEVAQWAKYNPEGAKKLLAEAGYPDGFDASIKLSSAYVSPFPEEAEAIVGFLQDIGIKAKPRFMAHIEWAAFSNRGEFGDDNMAFGLISNMLTPLALMPTWYGKAPVTINRSRINDPKLDALIEQLLVETDPDKAKDLYRQLDLRLIDQAYEITTGAFPTQFTGMRDYVKGFYGVHQYYAASYLERIWMDK